MTHHTRAESGVEIIKRAMDRGRPIIPFLGAGLSAASGFPLTNELRDYLCKVRFLIEGGVYRHLLGEAISRQQTADSPQFQPARYIDCFGWPDFNQIDADLWWFFIDEAVRMKQPSRKKVPTQLKRLDDFRQKKLVEAYVRFRNGNHSGITRQWGAGRWTLQSAVHHVILEDLDFHDSRLARSVCNSIWELKLKPRIDWFRYLLDLAGGRRGLVDSLFSQLNTLREPSLGHIVLAQLAKDFGWRYHLTINFDTLLETAFRREGLNPVVFEVSRETEPPDPALVNRSELALVKLHGGAFDLRIGEPIDHSLDESTRARIFGCVPDDALLLVIGFSGYERRMMQLLEELVIRRPRRPLSDEKILWMHCEDKQHLPVTVWNLVRTLSDIGRGKDFVHRRLSDAGLFLLEAYQSLATTLPQSQETYQSLPKRVVFSPPDDDSSDSEQPTSEELEENPLELRTFQMFGRTSLRSEENVRALRPGMILDSDVPSLRMSNFAQTKVDYRLIWVDLEDHHTVSGIVAEIVHKMRAFDPHLPHLILPVDDNPSTSREPPLGTSEAKPNLMFDKAIRYIRRALRRGRYILAFDSVEGFGREQTAHHGLPADVQGDIIEPTLGVAAHPPSQRETYLLSRHTQLMLFFQGILESGAKTTGDTYSDWYCCFAVDEPSYRHVAKLHSSPSILAKVRRELVQFCKEFNGVEDQRRGDWIPEPTFTQPQLLNRISPLDAFWFTVTHLNAASDNAGKIIDAINTSGWSPPLVVSESDREVFLDDLFDHALRPIFTETPLSAIDDSLGVFLVLSVFRRPRSFAGIYSVISELFQPTRAPTITIGSSHREEFEKWLNTRLDELQTKHPLLQRMDGGFFWILHHLHEWTYKLLSEPVRRQCVDGTQLGWLVSDWPATVASTKDKQITPRGEKRINRLLYLLFVHSRVGRFYYMHTYKRSHDIAGMYEYLYHRISSLKYLATLRLLLERSTAHLATSTPAATRIWAKLEELFRREGIMIDSASNRTSFTRAIDALHLNYLQRVLNVLTREADAIVSRGTADTWLSWIEMLRFDLYKLKASHAELGATPRPIYFDMEWMLNRISVQLLREKGARRRCVDRLFPLMFAVCERSAVHLSDIELGTRHSQHSDVFAEAQSLWERFKQHYLLLAEAPGSKSAYFQIKSETPPKEIVDLMQEMVASVSAVLKVDFLRWLLSPNNYAITESTERDLTRFLWCFRNCCACLRYYADPGQVRGWLSAGRTWIEAVVNVTNATVESLGSSDEPLDIVTHKVDALSEGEELL